MADELFEETPLACLQQIATALSSIQKIMTENQRLEEQWRKQLARQHSEGMKLSEKWREEQEDLYTRARTAMQRTISEALGKMGLVRQPDGSLQLMVPHIVLEALPVIDEPTEPSQGGTP